MDSPNRAKTDRARGAALVLVAASAALLPCCTSPGDRTCRAFSNDDLARYANDAWCDSIAVHESSLETLDGLQGADKNIGLTFNSSLMDVSAVDSARFVNLNSSPTEDVVMTAAGFAIYNVPLRTASLGLRWPVPHEPLDPDEPFPEARRIQS